MLSGESFAQIAAAQSQLGKLLQGLGAHEHS
jgi:hypothetical protein